METRRGVTLASRYPRMQYKPGHFVSCMHPRFSPVFPSFPPVPRLLFLWKLLCWFTLGPPLSSALDCLNRPSELALFLCNGVPSFEQLSISALGWDRLVSLLHSRFQG